MKKRFLLVGAAAVLVMATVVGGTLAAGQVSGDQPVRAALAATNLSIELNGDTYTAVGPSVDYAVAGGAVYMPGDTIPLQTGQAAGVYSVTNTGSVASYVRVTVSKYWDEYTTMDAALLKALENSDGWIESSPQSLFGEDASGGTQVFYYASPLQPGESTSSLLTGIELDATLGNDYQNQLFHLEALAEGVQFAGADHNDVNESGILSTWGVKPTLDAGGSITDILQ